jgi:hypothetical protein
MADLLVSHSDNWRKNAEQRGALEDSFYAVKYFTMD